MFEKTYDWWCTACEHGCDESRTEPLREDAAGYVLCPNCDNRLIGFDERDDPDREW